MSTRGAGGSNRIACTALRVASEANVLTGALDETESALRQKVAQGDAG